MQQDVAEATALGDDVMKKIVGTSLDKPSEITALAAMDEQERQQIVEPARISLPHGGIGIRLPTQNLIFAWYFFKKNAPAWWPRRTGAQMLRMRVPMP